MSKRKDLEDSDKPYKNITYPPIERNTFSPFLTSSWTAIVLANEHWLVQLGPSCTKIYEKNCGFDLAHML